MISRISVRGVVQGVGFRPTVKRVADRMGLKGIVRNDGSSVTIIVTGDPDMFMGEVKGSLGPIADIGSYSASPTSWHDEGIASEPEGFTIVHSTIGPLDSQLPPDTSICDRCLAEMMGPNDRRYLHPFTNCTDCGARYTVIETVPYDRERTTMSPFRMCPECSREYEDIGFRRFHAQTLSCPADGPRYEYLDKALERRSVMYKAVLDAARDISLGKMVVVKGWGGFHIVCDPSDLDRMRTWYGRPFKPFAIMCRDLSTVLSVTRADRNGIQAITSPARPITLLRKAPDPPDWARKGLDLASPGLYNIGLYLPYAGIQHLLFRALEEIGSELRWLVMTSANVPGEPMALDIRDASALGADGYLTHDRRIANRCDDTVLVPNPVPEGDIRTSRGQFGTRSFMIRRARGMVPTPISIGHNRKVLGLGAERNLTLTLAVKTMAYTTPYLGNAQVPSVMDHAVETASRLRAMYGGDCLDSIVIDAHPAFATGRWGRVLAATERSTLMTVQHHFAHAASLMVDSGMDHIDSLILDGVGYGDDGTPWGAEVIRADMDSYERAGHLAPFGLPGGDRAVHHPERIAFWLTRDSGSEMELDPRTASVLERTRNDTTMTSSMGRLLDALSAISLGITWRTYDGEPAMRLETLLDMSREPATGTFPSDIENGVVGIKERWGILIEELFPGGRVIVPGHDMTPDARTSDLVAGFVFSILDDLVSVACEGATTGAIGLSGGVAYDIPIVKAFVGSVRARGLVPVLHSNVPPGDGGISVGQAAIGGHLA